MTPYNLRADTKPMTAIFEATLRNGDTFRRQEIALGQVDAMRRAREQGWKLISLKAVK